MAEVKNGPANEVTEADKQFAYPCTNCGPQNAKHNTIHLCKRVIAEQIPGSFVECGVNAGAHPAVMAYVSKVYGESKRKVHLFDSFMGHPKAGPDDTEFDQRTLGLNADREHGQPSGTFIAEQWQVELNMTRWGVDSSLLEYHKGWLQDVLPVVAPLMGPIAVLRTDVDLYDSTVPVMKYLYPLVSKGGYIISDDFGEAGATPARLATLKTLKEMGFEEPEWTRLTDPVSTVYWRKP